MASNLEVLVSELKAASDAYYNGTVNLLTDEEYDMKREKLEKMVPNHPFLKMIGATPTKTSGVCLLPARMSSLQKIKPATGQVNLFSKRTTANQWVISDKLDGVSMLWHLTKGQLYLRGDGIQGVNVSHLVPYIQGLIPPSAKKVVDEIMIRGELMVKNSDCPSSTIPRSWTNGIVHQKTLVEYDARKLRFVAYEVILPDDISRSVQMDWLAKLGFEVAWNIRTDTISDDSLIQTLKRRRAECSYTMDGLVVAENIVPLSQSNEYKNEKTISLPKDMRAFKMTMEDQCVNATVIDVLWGASNQGFLIPRIQIEPIHIQGANIQYLTGHNAQNIKVNNIGPGTKIVVRRSGDVIPTLDSVITSTVAKLPDEPDTWVWNGVHICLKPGQTKQTALPKLQHFTKTIGVEKLGPGLLAKLVDNGIMTPSKLYSMSAAELSGILGPNIGQTIWTNLRKAISTIDKEVTLMVASSICPRSSGEIKLTLLFDIEPDIKKWKNAFLVSPTGWSASSIADLLKCLDEYITWRNKEVSYIPFPIVLQNNQNQIIQTPVIQIGVLCFTGFRPSTEMEKQCLAKGYSVSDSLTSKTTHLIVADANADSESGKVKKAREKGIQILSKTQLTNLIV